MHSSLSVVLIGFVIWSQPSWPANGQSTGLLGSHAAEVPTREEPHPGPTVVQDDLSWLVGRWQCVSRQYLTTRDLTVAVGDSLLEYFNVYLPYSDDRLTLRLTDNPDDRPLAAEFLVRHVYDVGEFREQLVPMFESGPVRIGKDHIWYGSPMSEDFDFKYATKKRSGRIWLILESRAMRFELTKLLADVGDIHQSYVTAPVKGYSPERLQELKNRYGELTKQLQSKSHPTTASDRTADESP
jgi:hypothetical protein